MNFSEESAFLLKNWSQLEKFHAAENNLRKDVSNLLHTLEDVLSKKYWWDNTLSFNSKAQDQVYISRRDWSTRNHNLIWIGIEDFCIERLFGSGFSPRCFLYCLNVGDRDLIRDKLYRIIAQDQRLRNNLTEKKGYVLIKHMKKYTTDNYLEFIEGHALLEIADFIEEVYLKIKDFDIGNV